MNSRLLTLYRDADPRRTFGVYCILNTETDDLYIGSVRSSFQHRWSQHRSHLRKGEHHSLYLQRAWDKYGADSFVFCILEVVTDPTVLIPLEQHWIDLQLVDHPRDTLYNISLVAGYSDGGEWTDSRRKEQSARSRASNLIRYSDADERRKQAAVLAEIRANPVYQQRHLAAVRAANQNEARRAKNSAALRERWADPATRLKQSDTMRRIKSTPEERERQSNAMRQLRQSQPERYAGSSKLTSDDARRIRELYAAGEYSQPELARMFGVSYAQIVRIVKGLNWKEE